MAYEQREGQGSLFKNDKTKDNQPDYTGSAMVGGVLYKVAGWIKGGRDGSKYMSLKIEPKTAGSNAGKGGQYEPAQAGGSAIPDSDIPW